VKEQVPKTGKQRPGRPGCGRSTQVHVRLPPNEIKAIDDYIKRLGGRTSRPVAMRELIRWALSPGWPPEER